MHAKGVPMYACHVTEAQDAIVKHRISERYQAWTQAQRHADNELAELHEAIRKATAGRPYRIFTALTEVTGWSRNHIYAISKKKPDKRV